MSAFRGILTGFGMAAIKDKEAKDNARMEVVKAAGLDYHTNQLPEHKKMEANRAQAYNQLITILGSEEAADYFDANGFITGDGKDVERIQTMLKDKQIKPDAFKNYIPTENYSDRYNQRQSDFESRFDIVKDTFKMQGSGIGPSTIDGLLTKPEGDLTRTIEGEPGSQVGPVVTEGTPDRVETIDRTTSSLPISAFYGAKPDERGVETKYNQVVKAIEEQNGYADTMTIGADGSANFTWGPKRKIAAAHAQFATMLLDKDKSLDQNTAASAAKRYLVFYTEKPFKELENIPELKGSKYVPGDGIPSTYTGARNIDVNSVQYEGVSIKDFILNKIDNLPTTEGGEINEAIFQKFVENVPKEFMDGDISFRDSLLAQRQTQNLENNYFSLNN